MLLGPHTHQALLTLACLRSGGTACPACKVTQQCKLDTDCVGSLLCNENGVCAEEVSKGGGHGWHRQPCAVHGSWHAAAA